MAEFQSLYRKKTRNLTAKEAENTGISHYRFHINFAVYGRISIIIPKKTRNFAAKETENTGTSHYRFHINFAVYGRVLIIIPKKDKKSNGKGS